MENVSTERSSRAILARCDRSGVVSLARDFVMVGARNPRVRRVAVAAASTAVCLFACRSLWRKTATWVRARQGSRDNAVAIAAATDTRTDNGDESILPGSEIYPGTVTSLPACVKIVVVRDPANPNAFIRAGNAIRLGDSLVLPTHVIARATDFYVVSADGKSHLRIETTRTATLAPDVSYARLDASEFSKIAMAAAHVAAASLQISVTAHSFVAAGEARCDAYYSTGQLSRDDTFGHLRYSGSTRPGFSGGLYAVGKQCYGMHLRRGPAGSCYNVGISLSYLSALLQARQGTPESTEEWLFKLTQNGGDVRWMEEDDDYYLFEYRGRFYAVPREEYDTYVEEQGFDQDPYPGRRDADVDSEGHYVARRRDKRRANEESDIDSDAGEAASHVGHTFPSYAEDQIRGPITQRVVQKVKATTADHFLVNVTAANDTPAAVISELVHPPPVEPTSNDPAHNLDKPRVMNSDVKERLQAKAAAISEQKALREMHDVIVAQLQQCSKDFAGAGSNVEKHNSIQQRYQALLEDLTALKPMLTDVNVKLSQASALTVEEKRIREKDRKARTKARKEHAAAGFNQQMQDAVDVEVAEDDVNEAAKAVEAKTPTGVKEQKTEGLVAEAVASSKEGFITPRKQLKKLQRQLDQLLSEQKDLASSNSQAASQSNSTPGHQTQKKLYSKACATGVKCTKPQGKSATPQRQ